MRPPVIAKRRNNSNTLALFGFLAFAVVFLVWNIWTLKAAEPKDRKPQPQRPRTSADDALSFVEGDSPVIETELEFFPEKDFDERTTAKPSKGGFPRIFCMVPSQPHAREKFRTILDTWGPWCDGIRFMIDPPKYSEPGEEASQPEEETEEVTSSDGKVTAKTVLLNKLVRKKGNSCFTGGSEYNPVTGKNEPVFTMCRHIWEKVWRSWVYVADHLAEDYDFFFKVDDDTFFFVPTMRQVLVEKGFKATEHHYFGQRVFPLGPDRPLIAGALVGFSRATLKRVAEEYKQMPHEYGDRRNFKHGRCVDRDGATEEVTTSICVRQIGVQPEALYDETLTPRRPHMLLWMPRDMLTFSRRDNSSSWFYKHAPRDVGTLENCCSHRPVGFHFMRRDEDLIRVHDLIVDPKNKKELEDIVRTKVPEWRAASPSKKVGSSIDQTFILASTSALEAEYWLRVKQWWHSQDPKEHERRLYD